MKKKEKLRDKINLTRFSISDSVIAIPNKPINLSSMGDLNIGDLPGSPTNYTYCAGNYCVECHQVYFADTKEWKQQCTHYTINVTKTDYS